MNGYLTSMGIRMPIHDVRTYMTINHLTCNLTMARIQFLKIVYCISQYICSNTPFKNIFFNRYIQLLTSYYVTNHSNYIPLFQLFPTFPFLYPM